MLRIALLLFYFSMLSYVATAQIGRSYTSQGGEILLESVDGTYYYSNKKIKQQKLEVVSFEGEIIKLKFANSRDETIYVFTTEQKCDKVSACIRINPDNSKTRFESDSDPCFGR